MSAHDPDLIAAVLAHYGRTRAADVATAYGLPSRHSVIGIWNRARSKGLLEKKEQPRKTSGDDPAKSRKPRLPVTVRKLDPEPEARRPAVPPAAPMGNGVKIMQLHHWSCRWVLGEVNGALTRYCGHPKAGKGAYCAHHRALAYTSPKEP